ncbi:hypothetical protein IC229_07635 [Spirosoma sp. BT702]|uniref:Right-handed parallel beta-helix repeat-containing protein n=1 Tax=Spirosoma profusum TaxID=2771354 RepID=A0A926XVH6_9BACT|nr:hypothetical protein [Spirosoma profusum]MBD2700501.1 hypothetical protein [Spirosoma profusum]
MKTLLLAVYCLLFCCSSYAKIWRVNNNSGINVGLTTLQAAHDAAASGDTIHVEGSPNSYGTLTSTKKLTIIGPGFFLDANTNLQAFTQTARISGITYYVGSEGSVVLGMDFSGNSINVFCNDIIIKRNKFSSFGNSDPEWQSGTIGLYYKQNDSSIPVNNIIITQNFGFVLFIQQPSTGILVTNNYMFVGSSQGEQTESLCINSSVNAVTLIQNNVFRRGKVRTYTSTLTNNIMYVGTFEGTDNLLSNNIGSGTQFGTANNNKSNIDMSTVFVLTGSPDGYFKLKSGSPAIGAGYGSTAQNPVDAGMFGGQTPYVLSGIPPIPSVYFFENQPVGSSADPIDVTVKVRSNN